MAHYPAPQCLTCCTKLFQTWIVLRTTGVISKVRQQISHSIAVFTICYRVVHIGFLMTDQSAIESVLTTPELAWFSYWFLDNTHCSIHLLTGTLFVSPLSRGNCAITSNGMLTEIHVKSTSSKYTSSGVIIRGLKRSIIVFESLLTRFLSCH